MMKRVKRKRSRPYFLGIPLVRGRAPVSKPAPPLPPMPTPETQKMPQVDLESDPLEAARDRVAQEVKFEILSPTQAKDNQQRIHEISRSFLSDTVTVPSPEMFQYAVQASLGDDVFHEPCTALLEQHVAQLAGKDAGIFIPSGTMSNQLALRTHLTQPPHSVLLDGRAHINKYEAGGVAYHNGAATIAVLPSNGHHLTLEDVKRNIVLGSEIHSAATRVVALENTLNGTIFPQDEIVAISEFVRAEGIIMHLDGARIWHVAAESGTSIRELCAPFDSVSMCFSKGLGAPIGSVLVGSAAFIKKARWLRKLFGGGMRQTGFMAGAAAYALTHNFERLTAVHVLTRRLEQGLADLGVTITSKAETCMVFFDATHLGIAFAELIERAAALPDPIGMYGSRLVVHIQTSPQAVDDLVALVAQLIEEKRAAAPPAAHGTHVANGNAAQSGATSQYQDVFVRVRGTAKPSA